MRRRQRILASVLSLALIFSALTPNAAFAAEKSETATVELRTNDAVNPIGIDSQQPVFSWKMDSDIVGQHQQAYRIVVSSDQNFSDPAKQVWDSGKVTDSRSVGIAYQGDPLSPGAVYYWRVTVWDKDGREVSSDEAASFEMGIFGQGAWDGSEWIQTGKPVSLRYTVEADVTVEQTAVNLLFNAKDQATYYMWQIAVSGNTVTLKPHTFRNGAYTSYDRHTKDITEAVGGAENLKTTPAEVTIDVTNQAITTFINGRAVDSIAVSELDPSKSVAPMSGSVGFRSYTSSDFATQEQGTIDNLKLTSYQGENPTVVKDYDFETENPFTAGALKDGALSTKNETAGILISLEKTGFRYTVESDVQIEKGAFGLLFNTVDASNYYMWQLSTSDGSTVQLKPHYKRAGGYTVLMNHIKDVTWAVEGGFEGMKTTDQKFKVELTETQINTYLNGKLVDTVTLSELDAIGVSWDIEKVGFRSDNDSKEIASIDNLVVTDFTYNPDGDVARRYDFDGEQNPLTGGSFQNGRLMTGNAGSNELIAYETYNPVKPVLHYEVEADVICLEAGIGVVFNATDANNFYMWQFNTYNEPGKVLLRPHVWKNGTVSSFDNTSHKVDVTDLVGGVEGFQNNYAHVKIDVTDLAVSTYINGVLADTFPVSELTNAPVPEAGKIGFRSDHGDGVESGIIDNLTMSSYYDLNSDTPTLVYEYNFDDGENPFDVGIVEDGKLYTRNPQPGTWVGAELPKGTALFRTEFTPEQQVVSARVYSTSLGVYDLYLNGERVGTQENGKTVYDELKPTFTQAPKHVMYQTYDVTNLIQSGRANALSANVTSGWWSGNINGTPFGSGTGFRAKLVLTYQDGTQKVVGTDTTWKTTTGGPVLEADIYNGETYDANQSVEWRQAGFADSSWSDAMLRSDFSGEIIAYQGTPIRIREDLSLNPKSITVYNGAVDANGQQYGKINVVARYQDGETIPLKKGETAIFDFGQNAAGVPEITVRGAKGTVVSMHGGEMLNDNNGLKSRGNDGPEGSVYFANLRTAKATGTYIMNGSEQGETYHSTFTYYGYQYMQVTATEDVDILDMTSLVMTSVEEDTGTISTSNQDVNQLISNIRWGQYSNYVGSPTDCPQRDERLAWSADTQIFSTAASYYADSKAFLEKWLTNLRDAQQDDGQYTDVAPRNGFGAGNVGWADAGIIVPYNLYKMYGDASVLSDSYASMTKYMNWMEGNGGPTWTGWGDWLAPGSNNNDNVKQLVAKAYYAWDLQMMAEMAQVLGKTEDAEKYQQLYAQRKELFQQDYILDGVFQPSEQTSCIMALKVDLVPQEMREAVKQKLIDNIRANGNKLQTGFLGTGAIMQTLTEIGAEDVAYQLLLQRDNPSWLYSLDQGATTIWERWNSYTKESGFGDVGMNSFNHYSYGVVAEWMYRYMAGIEYDFQNPGFKHIVLQPTPGGGLTEVNASYESAYGKITSNWGYENHDTFVYDAAIPANTTATVYLPVENDNGVEVNGKDASELTTEQDGIQLVETKDGKAVFEAVAGRFTFKTKVERTYQVSVTDGDKRYPSTLLVNGEVQSVPFSQQVKYGDSILLEYSPRNDVDAYFSSVSGDVNSTSSWLLVSPDQNLDLVINNKAYEHENFALNKPVSTNSEELNLESYGWHTSYLTDGKKTFAEGTNGYTSDKLPSDDVSANPIWVEVDLGQNTVFDTVSLYPRSDKSFGEGQYAYCFPRDYEIQVRRDGESEYKTVYKVTDQPNIVYYKPLAVYLPETENARYVRLVATKLGEKEDTNRMQFSELTVTNLSAVNRNELADCIDRAKALNPADYTAESWLNLAEVLVTAENTMQIVNVDQARIDEVKELLQEAIAGLEPVAPPETKTDKAILESVLNYAREAKLGQEYSGVIESVRASFDAAFTNAEAINNQADATQPQIDAAWTSLMREIHKLGFQRGDARQLAVVLQQANLIDLDKYVPAGQPQFIHAHGLATALNLADSLQGEIDKAVSDLIEAMEALRFKADKSVLDTVLEQAAQIDVSAYTAASVEAFESARNNALAVRDDASLTAQDGQEIVNQAVGALWAALKNLAPKPQNAVAGDSAQQSTGSAPKTGEALPIAAASLLLLAAAAIAVSKKRR